MEGGKTWREAILSKDLKTLFKRFEVQIPNDPSGKSFAGKLLKGDFLRDIVQDVRSLADGVVITRKIDRNAVVKPGTMYAFEIDIGRMGDKCYKELTESGFLDQANKNLTRVLLIKAKSIGVIDAKLIVYGNCKYDVDRLDIYLQHIYEDFDEIAKLSAYKKISYYRNFVREMIDTFSTYNLDRVIIKSMERVLTRENIRRVCFEVVVRHDNNYVGTVENTAYNCRYSGTVTRIKEILTEETLCDTARKLRSEICKGILMSIESVVQTSLSAELGKTKSDMSNIIFGEIDAIISARVGNILRIKYGVISETPFFITIFRPVDVNSEEWRSQVANEVYFNIWKKRDFLRDYILGILTNLCLITRKDFEFITSELEEFQKRVIPEDQKQLIKEWEQRDIIKHKSSLQNHPSIVKFIVGHKGDRKPVVKVFTRGDEETTKSFFISCCNVSKDTKFEFENVQDTNKLYDDDEKVTYVSDKRKSKDLQEFIQRNAKKIYAKYSNIVGIRISCGSRFGDTETDSHGIILYCLDKSIIPFGENPLPKHLSGWPCIHREDFFMFGKCPEDCLSTNDKLPVPGCSIGIPVCAWLGSVGFLYESINPNNEFGSGFLTASHVAIKDFKELYHDETPLSNHSLRSKKYLIVHPTCQNDQHVGKTNEHYQVVGEVVESFIGNFGTSGKSLDIAIVRSGVDRKEDKEPLPVVNEDDLSTGENINVMKKGSTTGTTYGDLLDCSYFTRIDAHPLSPCFFSMENVYLVGNKSKNKPFSKEGDSGSGVFLMGKEPYKPLGLVIGSSKNFQQTLVCKIDEFLDKFGLKIV